MDMQNVSSLVIPEGEVRTIHDKDNRLIWGRLSYDTRYMGNTIQDGTPTPSTPVDIDVVNGEQTVTVTEKNLLGYDYASLKSSNSGSGRTWDDATKSVVYNGVAYKLNDDGSITANGTASGTSYLILVNSLPLTVGDSYILNGCPSGGSTSTYSIRLYNGGNYTTDSGNGLNFTYSTQGIVRINVSNGTVVNNMIFKPMIRNSSDTNTTYEPHQSQPYTIDLGSIELCKIGDYQDYIYKSGDDWYVHKAIWKISSYNGETITTDYISTTGILTNGATVYYCLVTPTDTQITDATLVGQLNSVHQFLTRYGYNSAVTGNLPLIVNRTNL